MKWFLVYSLKITSFKPYKGVSSNRVGHQRLSRGYFVSNPIREYLQIKKAHLRLNTKRKVSNPIREYLQI